jgi:hypothetical protein
MTSLDALELKELPKDGTDRYFVWLCKLNDSLPLGFQLSDSELKKLAVLMGKKIK